MIGQTQAFLEALRLVKKIAHCDATVLIKGETGTGKELIARLFTMAVIGRNILLFQSIA